MTHELEPEELAEKLDDDGWQVIDVREPHEREAGHIGGTRHLELERLTSEAQSIDQDRPVVFYCRVGARSGMAAQAFRASGWEVYNMRGGIVEWERKGLPLEPAGGRVAPH